MKHVWRSWWWTLFLTALGALSALSADQPHPEEGISGNIFGRKNGIVHPFVSITERYTDNLTNSCLEQESESITVVSPGFSLALPGTGGTDVRIISSTAAPGGLALSRQKMDIKSRFQSMAVYNAAIEKYRNNSEEDFTGHNFTGALQYKAPGWLTIDIANKYQYAQEMWGETGDNPDHETYADNLTHAIVELAFSPKFSISASGAYHTVAYRHKNSEFRDRGDMVYSGALNFHVSPKTKLFCEYKRIDVIYDAKESAGRDSAEDFVYAGVSWDITAKSRGTCKIGYVTRDIDDPVTEDPSSWTGQIDIVHMFTDRTMMMVSAVREFYETNLPTSDYYTTNRLSLTYNQAFTPKLSGNILLSYQNDDYEGPEIGNDIYRVGPGLAFSPYRWLTFQLAYSHSKRDSEQDSWEYTANEYSFSVKASF